MCTWKKEAHTCNDRFWKFCLKYLVWGHTMKLAKLVRDFRAPDSSIPWFNHQGWKCDIDFDGTRIPYKTIILFSAHFTRKQLVAFLMLSVTASGLYICNILCFSLLSIKIQSLLSRSNGLIVTVLSSLSFLFWIPSRPRPHPPWAISTCSTLIKSSLSFKPSGNQPSRKASQIFTARDAYMTTYFNSWKYFHLLFILVSFVCKFSTHILLNSMVWWSHLFQ